MAGVYHKLHGSTKNMVKKAKTYGKKGANSLSDAFNKLSISTSPQQATPTKRGALVPISGNSAHAARNETVSSRGEQPPSTGKAALYRGPYDQQDEITALLCLDFVHNEVQLLKQASETWARSFNVTKIAQGSYASILRMQLKTDPDIYTVWKLMPIKHSEIWNKSLGVNETLIRNAATEIMALELMTDVPGFVELRSATVLEGPPTNLLQKVFDEWTTNHPEDKVNCEYGENQLWLLAEMTDAGTDLETLLAKGFPEGPILDMYTRGAGLSLKQAWDIFFLTAEALAHGEQHAHFEHRDLHPGNVCIKFTDAGFMSPLKNISIKKSQRIRPYTNIEVTIIDYTLSRATLTEGNVLAHGMQDKSIFTQTSFNFNDKRQYDTYRWMRNVFEGTEQRHPKSDTSKLWKAYVPMTNVIWLHHLLTILLQKTVGFYYDGTRYKGKTEKKLASTLVNLRTDLEPANVLSCDYVTATDIVRSELDGKQRILCDAKKDERDYSHEAEYMRTLRAARSDRLESAASYS